MYVRVQNLVDLLLGLLVDAVLFLWVPDTVGQVIHRGEIIVAFPLGSQADFIAVVLNL